MTGSKHDAANRTRARLAATHVVAVVDQRADASRGADFTTFCDRIAPFVDDSDARIGRQLKIADKRIPVEALLAAECANVLRDAPMTINIEPYKFFGARVEGDRFQSIWNRLRAKAPGYADPREDAEQLMFGYSNDADDGQVVGDVDVGTDIARFGATQGLGADGQPRSHSFVAEMRPKYAGVNFTWAKFGAACTYGLSHFVLKHHLRFNAAYSPRDSFGIESRAQLGTYRNIYPVLVHCADYVLQQIIQSARSRRGSAGGAPADPPDFPIFHHEKNKGADGSKGSDYVEAILHTEVVFKRDVEELRIARQEIADKKTGDVTSQKTWTVKRRTIERNLQAFVRQHGLAGRVTYI